MGNDGINILCAIINRERKTHLATVFKDLEEAYDKGLVKGFEGKENSNSVYKNNTGYLLLSENECKSVCEDMENFTVKSDVPTGGRHWVRISFRW